MVSALMSLPLTRARDTPGRQIALRCVASQHCTVTTVTIDQQCSVIQMLNGLVCATIEHRVITCMIVEHLSLSIKSCVSGSVELTARH